MAGIGHVHDVFAVKGVFSGAKAGAGLLGAQTILIVFEGNGLSGFAHRSQLLPMLPGISPRSVIQRVANRVIRNAVPVEGCQLVTPRRGVAIGVCRGDAGAADGILRGCEGIRRLAQNIPTEIVGENPSGASGVGLVVDTNLCACVLACE